MLPFPKFKKGDLVTWESQARGTSAKKTGKIVEVVKPLETPSLARAEWEHINRVLSDCGGNISEAARRLGIHRRSLQRKLQKYPPAR